MSQPIVLSALMVPFIIITGRLHPSRIEKCGPDKKNKDSADAKYKIADEIGAHDYPRC